MTRAEVRPATADALAAFYGARPRQTVRALVGVADGKVIGVGGFAYEAMGVLRAFADLTPEAKARRVTLHKAARAALASLGGKGVTVIATADPDEPTAARWLARLGFAHVGPSADGEVWVWRS